MPTYAELFDTHSPQESPTPDPTDYSDYNSDLEPIDLTGNSSLSRPPTQSPGMPPITRQKRRADQISGSIRASAADAPPTTTTSMPGPSTRSTKRRRTSRSDENGRPPTPQTAGSRPGRSRRQVIEIEDVVNVEEGDALNDTLQKQRQEQIASQNDENDKPQKLSTLSCTICLDSPTDLTATACGHMFCHECLQQALIASENRDTAYGSARAQCPVCRKALNRKKGRDVIPLLLMKNQPRKKVAAAKSS